MGSNTLGCIFISLWCIVPLLEVYNFPMTMHNAFGNETEFVGVFLKHYSYITDSTPTSEKRAPPHTHTHTFSTGLTTVLWVEGGADWT